MLYWGNVNVTAPLLSPSYLYINKSIRVMSHPGVILHFQVPKGEMTIVQWGDGPSVVAELAIQLQRKKRYCVKVTDSLQETEMVFSCSKNNSKKICSKSNFMELQCAIVRLYCSCCNRTRIYNFHQPQVYFVPCAIWQELRC